MRLETEFTVGWVSEIKHKFSQEAGVQKVSNLGGQVDIDKELNDCYEDRRLERGVLLFAQRLQQTAPSWRFTRAYNGTFTCSEREIYIHSVS